MVDIAHTQCSDGLPLQIIIAQRDHIADIFRIEKENFSRPWTVEAFAKELGRANGHFWVALMNGELVGYQIGWLIIDEYHLHTIAVASSARGKGVGLALLRHIKIRMAEIGVHSIELEVRAGNVPALALYQREGFVQVGLRKNYYQLPTDDAILMQFLVG